MTELGGTDAQCTPKWLADLLGDFTLDVCSNPRSHIRARYTYSLEKGDDGLEAEWFGQVWCNGPYSNPLPWCNRLSQHPSWAALWKLDPTTKWFLVLAETPGVQWAPFRKRIRFENPRNCGVANFASVLFWRNWDLPPSLAPHLWLRSGDGHQPQRDDRARGAEAGGGGTAPPARDGGGRGAGGGGAVTLTVRAR